MPAPSLDTQMIKAILEHRLARGESLARCAQALGVSKGVVSKYVTMAHAQGLVDWSHIESMSDAELRSRLLSGQDERCPCVPPDLAMMHRELSRKGMTLMLLWQEYQAEHVGQRTLQYSQFCERYRQYVKTLRRSMRQIHVAGEKLFVDFAGPTLALRDGSRAHLFVAALGASHYTYAQAMPGQKTTDWISGMVGALHYMVRPEQPASLPDSLCLNPGTTLLKLQDLRSWRFVFLQILRGSHGSKAITTTDW